MRLPKFSLSDNTSLRWKEDDLQHAILTQLSQATTTMHHIDEVFQWLVHMAVHRFGVQAAQVWAMQANSRGQLSPQLRSILCQQNLSIPHVIIDNAEVATVAGHLLSKRRHARLLLVDGHFPQYRSLLLKRYGLYYCAGIFVSGDMLLPPPHTSESTPQIATPLTMMLLLFFQHTPHKDVLPIVDNIVTQAVPIALARDFLLSATAPANPTLSNTQPLYPAFSELVAYRVEDPMSNPISAAMVLPEAELRRVYAAINDRRDVAELSRLTNLDLKDLFQILQRLMSMQRIELHEPTGRLVEDLHIFSQ
jgi:hypothetical protein